MAPGRWEAETRRRGDAGTRGHRDGEARVVWLWQGEARLEDAISTAECPVSYVTAESMAWLEDFYTHHALGHDGEVLRWPARRVDAFLVLRAEWKKLELDANAKR